MNIRDRAESGGPEIVLARDLPTKPAAKLSGGGLHAADDLTPEGQFPEFGQFLKVFPESLEGTGWADEPEYWECPQSLASMIVEELGDDEDPTGLAVKIRQVVKDPGGAWSVEGIVFDPSEEE